MAEIFQFTPKKPELVPIPELIERAFQSIDAGWTKGATSNRLNDFFVQGVPAWVQPGVNYISDLNAIAEIERAIDIPFTVKSPGKELGWVASFSIKEAVIETPFMLSEAYARCFNILLYVKLKRDLIAHGYSLE